MNTVTDIIRTHMMKLSISQESQKGQDLLNVDKEKLKMNYQTN